MANWENPGYPIEYHNVVTEDRYIVTLTRVRALTKDIHSEDDPKNHKPKPVVLFVHGLVSSAEHWTINSPDKVLPYRLVNEGYDCWLANNRGTPLSQSHTDIQEVTNSRKYWDFSWQEVAHFDIPAILDYILTTTGNENLSYVGHSMGCLFLITGLSFRPEYCSKIKVMVALSPSVYGAHIRNKAIRFGITIGGLLGKSKFITNREICGTSATRMVNLFFPWTRCFPNFGFRVIKAVMRISGAYGMDQIEPDRLAYMVTRIPASTSMKLLCHWLQGFQYGVIRQYNYGTTTNLKKYGQDSPPGYDFSKVKVPVAVFYADDDEICPPGDVIQLSKELPNLIGLYQINQPRFSHIDFLYGKDVNNLVYDRVMEIIRSAHDSTNTQSGSFNNNT